MTHRDLAPDAGWYDIQYAGDPSCDNVFGREDLAERSKGALLSHVRAGGSPLTFPRASSRTVEETTAMLDRAVAGMMGMRSIG